MVVEINELELNYEIAGDGEPLLWLHGFMGAGPDWKYIFKEPPAGFRLIAPDLQEQDVTRRTSRPNIFTRTILTAIFYPGILLT